VKAISSNPSLVRRGRGEPFIACRGGDEESTSLGLSQIISKAGWIWRKKKAAIRKDRAEACV